MRYFRARYDCSVIIYDCRTFIRLTTKHNYKFLFLRKEPVLSFSRLSFFSTLRSLNVEPCHAMLKKDVLGNKRRDGRRVHKDISRWADDEMMMAIVQEQLILLSPRKSFARFHDWTFCRDQQQ